MLFFERQKKLACYLILNLVFYLEVRKNVVFVIFSWFTQHPLLYLKALDTTFMQISNQLQTCLYSIKRCDSRKNVKFVCNKNDETCETNDKYLELAPIFRQLFLK